MSRVASNPVTVPDGVQVDLDAAASRIVVSGAQGSLTLDVHPAVSLVQVDGQLKVAARDASRSAKALSGTMRSLIANMVEGVSQGFTRALTLNGVGYRARLSGRRLLLNLGFSHEVRYDLPDGVDAQVVSLTRIELRGSDKQRVGQAAAEIRALRPPEPYKGKGIRHEHERVRIKETRKSK